MSQRHAIAGRLSGTSGIVTFCLCGLGFFALYGTDGVETTEFRHTARERADERWQQHWEQVRPEQWRTAHPNSQETQPRPHCGNPDPVEIVRDALRRQHGLIWSETGIDRQARLAVNSLRIAGLLDDVPPDPGKESS